MPTKRDLHDCGRRLRRAFLAALPHPLRTRLRLWKNAGKTQRLLEIGPGRYPLEDFETVDIRPGPFVDYVLDFRKPLPFASGTFELVYASHVLEHVPWYELGKVLREWVRILKPGGWLEVWVPNAFDICQALVDIESGRRNVDEVELSWFPHNPEKDPCLWATARLFRFGDDLDSLGDPGWHRAMFTPRFLRALLESLSLEQISHMDPSETRGHDHGWTNLGMKGRKPCTIATLPH